ncbi:LpqB family beta-propeller domain-containing protein [Streptomyces durmitorensis]|uniref:LpqB family beta-propeller domain-containing protein n=2 Tax=Streptomyces durmitorensis TaxID=319947 RepID=A0ABY4Q954_9ACTN|nr:LpqB family beta-propeller domain-containing protein [Streptomyces durmitorensis]UQT61677.1 LpqB family beta-propeller domain-containing protein [Streptomyces durmitorensis]
MPDSGNLKAVDASQRPDSQSQVRVYAMPPGEDASPEEIVQGFLEALTSDDPDFAMARKYLTKEASKGWDPDVQTTVLENGPSTGSGSVGDGGGRTGRLFPLTGRKVATVDKEHAYQLDNAAYNQSVHLSQQDGPNGKEWRIDRVPPGVVLGQSDFQRIYWSVNKYYFATRSTGAAGGGQEGLVADPVYIRQRIDPVTESVKALLDGPTTWLKQVVGTRFPTGTHLKAGTRTLAPDDQGKLTVPLNAKADPIGQERCTEMAAQMLFTLQDLTSSGVQEVELQRRNGSQLCVLSKERAESVASRRTPEHPDYQYLIDDKRRLVQMPAARKDDPVPVRGKLGSGGQPLRSAAVSRDEERAAGVSLDGRSLYMGSLVSDGPLGKPEVRSKAKSEEDGLSTPSWDGRGDLWVADRDLKRPRLLWLDQGAGEPVPVKIANLDGRIEAVRVSADGVRIALLVKKDGKTSLQIGRVERTGAKGEQPVISVDGLRRAAPQMEEVTAMSWAGGSRLVVVGRESGGVQQMRYVQCDGSVPAGATLPGLTGVKEIAASEDERQPLVAHSDDGIVRLPTGAQWQTVVKEGSAPVYPG